LTGNCTSPFTSEGVSGHRVWSVFLAAGGTATPSATHAEMGLGSCQLVPRTYRGRHSQATFFPDYWAQKMWLFLMD
jgi:hypothetical protein